MTNKSYGISLSDKKSIVAFMKLIHARTKAGEQVCISCYTQKVLHILDKYDSVVHTNSEGNDILE